MIRITELRLPLDHAEGALRAAVLQRLGVPDAALKQLTVFRRAYDARSTLFSPEVEDLMRQFPAHLTNGEPVLIPIDPSNPKGRTKPQASRLVEVPAF